MMPEITVKGMSCGHCVAAMTKAMASLPGVSEVAGGPGQRPGKLRVRRPHPPGGPGPGGQGGGV